MRFARSQGPFRGFQFCSLGVARERRCQRSGRNLSAEREASSGQHDELFWHKSGERPVCEEGRSPVWLSLRENRVVLSIDRGLALLSKAASRSPDRLLLICQEKPVRGPARWCRHW